MEQGERRMTEKEKQFNQWFDEYADGVKVFEEADMKQAYLQGQAELEKENAELKTGIALKDEEMGCIETDFNTFKSQAKELLKRFIELENCTLDYDDIKEAEQFLNSEVEK